MGWGEGIIDKMFFLPDFPIILMLVTCSNDGTMLFSFDNKSLIVFDFLILKNGKFHVQIAIIWTVAPIKIPKFFWTGGAFHSPPSTPLGSGVVPPNPPS